MIVLNRSAYHAAIKAKIMPRSEFNPFFDAGAILPLAEADGLDPEPLLDAPDVELAPAVLVGVIDGPGPDVIAAPFPPGYSPPGAATNVVGTFVWLEQKK